MPPKRSKQALPTPVLPLNLLTDTSLLQELTSTTQILHLLHHRNLNQHRHSIWWRHFSAFRRELRRLVADMTAHTALSSNSSLPISTSTNFSTSSRAAAIKRPGTLTKTQRRRIRANALKKAQRPRQSVGARRAELASRVAQRVGFWRQAGMVERWYGAFGQLVADVQYAPVGIVLLAVLGSVCKVCGLVEVQGEAEKGERTRDVREEGAGKGEEGQRSIERENVELDLGVPVLREEEKVDDVPLVKAAKKAKVTETREPKRMKRHHDAIDKLFDGL